MCSSISTYKLQSELRVLPQGNSTENDPFIGARYQIVIFTNQGGISLGADRKTIKGDLKRLKNFKEKISIILRHLDLPIRVYAATNKDKYRKPRRGMWEQMLEDCRLENKTSVDLGGSYFVGDAAGRGETGRYAADHSCSDRYPSDRTIVFSATKLMTIQGFRFEYRIALYVTRGVLSPRGSPTVRQRL